MDKPKRKNLAKLLGKDPEQMDRKQWDSALENLFKQIKKSNKDPFIAKEILNEKLLTAFSKDFTSFDKHKDINKQLKDILSLYGLTPEQAKRTELNLLKQKGREVSDRGYRVGGEAYTKDSPEFFPSIKEQEEYYKKGDFIPAIKVYDDLKHPDITPHATLPHEGLHVATMFQSPEYFPHSKKERGALSGYSRDLPAVLPKFEGETFRQSIQKDPSLKNILLQSQSTEHFQPVYPLNPPGFDIHERIFSKLHPFVSKPEVIPPEQPSAAGIFKKETPKITPALTQEELYNTLYDIGDKETFDPLRKRFNKIEDLFREIKTSPQKKAPAIKPEELVEPEEKVDLQNLIRDIMKSAPKE